MKKSSASTGQPEKSAPDYQSAKTEEGKLSQSVDKPQDDKQAESPVAIQYLKPTKIAILGTAHTSVDDAPYADPSWQIWNMSNNFWHKKRYDLWFEVHDYETLKASKSPPVYFEFLKDIGNKLIVGWPSEAWPEASVYPLALVLNSADRSYFTCSTAYMIAYALLLNKIRPGSVTELGFWGVDMAIGEEYSHQKPCVEYWIGRAEGMGIKVTIAPQSPICRAQAMYAFDNIGLSREFTERLKELHNDIKTLEAEMKTKQQTLIEWRACERLLSELCHRWAL